MEVHLNSCNDDRCTYVRAITADPSGPSPKSFVEATEGDLSYV